MRILGLGGEYKVYEENIRFRRRIQGLGGEC